MSDNPETSTDARTLPKPDEALTMARNIARTQGWRVFPVQADKRPRLKEWDKRASVEPDEITALWRQCPDPLIGVVTGVTSGVWVLDIDVKHQEAIDWWHLVHPRLLPTRAYRTRSGGFHCYYTGADGLRNSAGRPVPGVDVRGDGGYVVFWFAAGLECLDHSPPAPWPVWLRQAVALPVAPVAGATRGATAYHGAGDGGLRGLLDKVSGAAEGERNQLLFWAACRLFGKGLKTGEVEGLLVPIAVNAGLADPEVRRTIASAAQRAG